MSQRSELSEQKQTQLDNHADFSRRNGLTMIGSTLEDAITSAMTWKRFSIIPGGDVYHS